MPAIEGDALFADLQRATLWLEQHTESEDRSAAATAVASAVAELRQLEELPQLSYAVLEPLKRRL